MIEFAFARLAQPGLGGRWCGPNRGSVAGTHTRWDGASLNPAWQLRWYVAMSGLGYDDEAGAPCEVLDGIGCGQAISGGCLNLGSLQKCTHKMQPQEPRLPTTSARDTTIS